MELFFMLFTVWIAIVDKSSREFFAAPDFFLRVRTIFLNQDHIFILEIVFCCREFSGSREYFYSEESFLQLTFGKH